MSTSRPSASTKALGIALGLAAVLGFAAASGPPAPPASVTIPPQKAETPGLGRYFPARDLVVYAEFDGLDAHGLAFSESALGRILGETSTGRMIADVASKALDWAAMRNRRGGPPSPPMGAAVVELAEGALRRGFALGIVRPRDREKPTLLGLVLRGGAEGTAARIVPRLLAGLDPRGLEPSTLEGPGGRELTGFPGGPQWWAEGPDLVVSLLGEEGVAAVVGTLQGDGANASTHPVVARLKQADGGFEPVGSAFFDMAALPDLPPEATALGLDRLERLEYRWGFRGPAVETRTRIVAPAPRTGLLTLLDHPTFAPDDLPPIPGGLVGYTALSIDPAKLYRDAKMFMAASNPRAAADFRDVEGNVRDRLGLDLEREVLGPLGPRMLAYAVPERIVAPTDPVLGLLRGLLNAPKSALVVEVDDADAYAETLDGVLAEINKDLELMASLSPGGGFGAFEQQQFDSIQEDVLPVPTGVETPTFEPGVIEVSPGGAIPEAVEKSATPEVPKTSSRTARPGLLPAVAVGTLAAPPAQGAGNPSAPRFVALEGGLRGQELKVPPTFWNLPAGMRPSIVIGDGGLAIGTTPAVAAEALEARAGEGSGPPEGDRLRPAASDLPGALTLLHVSDPAEGLLPDLLANAPTLAESFAVGRPPLGPSPASLLLLGFGGMGRPLGSVVGLGRPGPKPMGLDRSLAPDPEAIRRHLFPSVYALAVDDEGVELVTREAFPILNPLALAPLAIAGALPALGMGRATAFQTRDQNNLKQIMLALHNFHDTHGRFPADVLDADGTPILSWRVEILPFLEGGGLSEQFRRDEPWDGSHNQDLLGRMPEVYRSSGAPPGSGETSYRAISGPSGFLDPAKPEGTGLADFTDGTSNTIAVVMSREAVPWTKPASDLPFDPDAGPGEIRELLEGLGIPNSGGFFAAFADGSVRFIRSTVNPIVLRSLFTRNRSEIVSSDSF